MVTLSEQSAILIVAGSILMGLLLWLANKIRKDKARTKRINEVVSRVMSRGTLETLDECLIVFPDACKRCGCRNFHYWVTREVSAGTVGPGSEERGDVYNYQCARCGDYHGSGSEGGYPTPPEDRGLPTVSGPDANFRVYSPYLSHEEADSILDLKYPTSQ